MEGKYPGQHPMELLLHENQRNWQFLVGKEERGEMS
jgi:hypothetical protein